MIQYLGDFAGGADEKQKWAEHTDEKQKWAERINYYVKLFKSKMYEQHYQSETSEQIQASARKCQLTLLSDRVAIVLAARCWY